MPLAQVHRNIEQKSCIRGDDEHGEDDDGEDGGDDDDDDDGDDDGDDVIRISDASESRLTAVHCSGFTSTARLRFGTNASL